MRRTPWIGVLVVLAVCVLHLAAHCGWSAPHLREALPEDAPAISANPQLARRPAEPLTDVLRRAVADPDSAWSPASARVGASRWRPVAGVALVAQRAVSGDGVLLLVGFVSLLLHALVALQSVALVRVLGGSPRAGALAGLLVAACPAALPAAAWPAHQAVVLGALLGLAGLHRAVRAGSPHASHGRLLVAGLLLALGGLAHEVAFGLVPAALVLSPAARRRGGALRLTIPALLALGVRLAVAPPAVGDGLAGVPAGASGVAAALLGLLLPGRLDLAAGGGPAGSAAAASPVVGLASLVVLGGAAWWLWRRRSHAPAAAALAALAALLPLLASGAYGGAPYSEAYAYIALPLFAVAVALGLVAAARRGPGLRLAAAVAGALLLGGYVAGTLTRAPAFRSRRGFVRMAASEMPGSPVVRAWQLGLAIVDAESAGVERRARLAALEPRVREVAATFAGPDPDAAPPLARDRIAAATGGSVLGRYTLAVSRARFEPDHPVVWTAQHAAETSTRLLPEWAGSWSVLARVRRSIGATVGAYEAAARAHAVEPGRPTLALAAAGLALEIGEPRAVLEHLDRLAAVRAAAGTSGTLREARLLRARAVAADASAQQLSYEFEEAARILQELMDGGDRSAPVLTAAYETYLHWGDHLVSIDKTGMALVAYRSAASLRGEESEAARHFAWLEERVNAEVEEAQAAVQRAREENAAGIADALLRLGIAHTRRGDWGTATSIFRKLEQHQGGLNPPLRFAVAQHLYASRIPDWLEAAEQEFRLVLEEEPRLVEARYRLAQVLLQQRRLEEALDQFERASEEGVAYEWGVDALIYKRRIEEVLRAGR